MRPTPTDPTAERPADRYRLSAMEIWGGSTARREVVEVPGIDAAIFSLPHAGAGAGGDLYFLSTCAMGMISRFTIADIAGHGEGAAAFASGLRSLIRKHINTPNPTKFARQLNEDFSTRARAGLFATALMTTYFAPSDHLIVCNAGHPRPLLYRARERAWCLFDEHSDGVVSPDDAKEAGVGNLPLGLLQGTSYPQFATRLLPGDMYVAYTDSIIESTDPAGRMLGERGLLDLVATLDPTSPDTLRDEILHAVSRHASGAAAPDDTTLLVLRHTGDDPPPQRLRQRVRSLFKVIGLVEPDAGRGFPRHEQGAPR